MTDYARGAMGRADVRGGMRRPSCYRYPAGVSVPPNSMITKHSRTLAMKSLRQDKILRDHDGTAGVIYVLNQEISGFDTLR